MLIKSKTVITILVFVFVIILGLTFSAFSSKPKEETRETIIETYYQESQHFKTIAEGLAKIDGIFELYYEGDSLVIYDTANKEEIKNRIESSGCSESLKYAVQELGCLVSKGKDDITFIMTSSPKEQGILFPLDRKKPNYYDVEEFLADNFYYYVKLYV